MGSFTFVTCVTLSFAAFAYATRYCECSYNGYYPSKVFTGINEVCGRLPDDYCSTNCNAFKKDCRYCEYIPAGALPLDRYNEIREWCINQRQAYTEINTVVRGDTLTCYTRGAIDECPLCGGCGYYNNDPSDRRRSQEGPLESITEYDLLSDEPFKVKRHVEFHRDGTPVYDRLNRRQNSVSFRDPANAKAMLKSEIVGLGLNERECSLIFLNAANFMVSYIAKTYTGCKATNSTASANAAKVDCGLLGDPLGQEKIEKKFMSMCDEFGGYQGPADDGPGGPSGPGFGPSYSSSAPWPMAT